MSLQQQQSKERAKQRRLLAESAIRLATQGKWEDAIQVNQELIELFPNDVEAHNRLGKALMELGRYRAARDAYAQSAEIDPNNSIAKKNLARLETLAESVPEDTEATRERVDPRIFIEETGRTGHTSLINLADAPTIARLTTGDQVSFQVDSATLKVLDSRGEQIGEIEPRLALRLISLMNGGNEYAAAITSLSERQVNIIIKEMYQHPSQAGKVSFPARAGDGFRGYIKSGVIDHDRDVDEEALEGEDFADTWTRDQDEPDAASDDLRSYDDDGLNDDDRDEDEDEL